MKRGSWPAAGALVAVVSVAVPTWGITGVAVAEAPMTARAFTVRAEGFPIEPAPGINETSLGVRPLGTRLSLANAPADAYGRAATTDLGTIELYTGPPPPGNAAECDASRPNIPRDAIVEPGGAHLEAHCTGRPSARVFARAGGPTDGAVRAANQSSRLTADGGGGALIATSDVLLVDVELGPLRIGTARFVGRVSANGRRAGATASGVVDAADATVAGVPVVVGTDGIAVDETRVPLELVPTAAESVRAAMAQGGYADIRLVRPAMTSAADGSRAQVHGGGIRVYLASNDPKRNYYLAFTLVGARLAVFAGAPLATAGPPGAELPGGAPPDPAVAGGAGANGGAEPVLGGPERAGGATPAAMEPLAGRSRYELPRPWRGWWLIAAGAAALAATVIALRRPLASWWDDAATRFLRG